MYSYRTLLYVALLVTLSNCSKYEDGPTVSWKTKTQRLNGVWSVITIDETSIVADNKITVVFENNGDFLYYDTQLVNDEIHSGNWKWGSHKKNVVINTPDRNSRWTITRLTDTSLWFTDENDKAYQCTKE